MDEHGAAFLEQEMRRLRQYRDDLEARLTELLDENQSLRDENEQQDRLVQELESRFGQDVLGEINRIEAENDALDGELCHLRELVDESVADQIERLEAENFELREQVREHAVVGPPDRRSSDEEPMYVASRKRSRFHRPQCEWAQFFLHSPALIEFGSHREAVEAGYKPCGTCRA